MQNDKKNPCYQCPRRYPGCSADCDDYKEWRAKRDELNKKAYNARVRDAKLTHYAVEQARKQKRRHK